VWHWPQFLMRDSYIGEVFPIGAGVFWVGWVLPTVAYSVIYTWIYNHTERSILSAILLHFMANFWGELLAVRGETVIYRSIWTVALAIAVVLIWGPGTLTRRAERGVS
jgi:ABC-type sugar transport system permease subunit